MSTEGKGKLPDIPLPHSIKKKRKTVSSQDKDSSELNEILDEGYNVVYLFYY